ncbi:MAG: amidohydrolase family protein, partial [Actinophytocola sp.]|uniref:amidohydrolase family protein n=1 Tax=Actinophytocola sp. TaxID=1872138 RepID=UPI001326A3D5
HVFSDADEPAAASLAARIAAQGVFVATTLVHLDGLLAANPGGPNSLAAAMVATRAMREAGVPLLAETDANPFAPVHGESTHRELELLVLAGLAPTEALAAATSLPALHFGLSDRGRVAPGLAADVVLVDGDPTTDITATQAVAGIWRRGTRLPSPPTDPITTTRTDVRPRS